MAVTDVSFYQHAVAGFLIKENSSPADILINFTMSMDFSAWLPTVYDTRLNTSKITTGTPLICLTVVREVIVQVGIHHSGMQEIIKTLGYQKFCCHWIP
jgi:hypothetical protein